MQYDSLLLVSFGGPEGPQDVMPFLERVTAGRNIPRERLEEVAEHYHHFGGVSPINQQNRELISALQNRFADIGLELPIYFGNRNWKPFLVDAIGRMRDDGKKRSLAFFTSLFSCYSGCRQYRENIEAARLEVGADAPLVEKVRFGFNHPGFISAMVARAKEQLERIPEDRRAAAQLIFTAHSIPLAMAEKATYQQQLSEAARLVSEGLGRTEFTLAWQSRSGAPHMPWLEPDINDVIRAAAARGQRDVVVIPIGFISDHMEVLFDLDEEALQTSAECGVNMLRAGTVGVHPDFVNAVVDLVTERIEGRAQRAACGVLGPWHDVCPPTCCLPR